MKRKRIERETDREDERGRGRGGDDHAESERIESIRITVINNMIKYHPEAG